MIYIISTWFYVVLQMVDQLVNICYPQNKDHFFKIWNMKQFFLSAFLGYSSLHSVPKFSSFQALYLRILKHINDPKYVRHIAHLQYVSKVKDNIYIFKLNNCSPMGLYLVQSLLTFPFLMLNELLMSSMWIIYWS